MSFGYNPFEEREPPPMSAELFTTLVVARLRSSGIEVEGQRRLEVTLHVRDAATVAHLDSYYQRYRAEPAALTPIIQQFIENVTTGAPEPAPLDAFEQIAPNLLPLLISSVEWQKKRDVGIRAVVRPLVQDLGVALVIDEPTAITYVQLEAIPQWNIDIDSAYDTALENLARRAQEVSVSQIGEGNETLLIDRTPDGYAATRAILPERLEDWSRRVSGELVLGLPMRDFLIGFSRQHPSLEALRAQVEQDARTHEHGLIPQLLVYRNGALEVVEDGIA